MSESRTDSWQAGARSPATLAALARRRGSIAGTVTAGDVERLFRGEPARRSVVVRRADGSFRLLNRSAFYQALVGPKGFGYALYFRKPVAALPAEEAITLPGDMPALAAGAELLGVGDVSGADDIFVESATGPLTIGVSELLGRVADANDRQAVRFQSLVRNLSDVVCVADGDGTLRYLGRPSTGSRAGPARRSSAGRRRSWPRPRTGVASPGSSSGAARRRGGAPRGRSGCSSATARAGPSTPSPRTSPPTR